VPFVQNSRARRKAKVSFVRAYYFGEKEEQKHENILSQVQV